MTLTGHAVGAAGKWPRQAPDAGRRRPPWRAPRPGSAPCAPGRRHACPRRARRPKCARACRAWCRSRRHRPAGSSTTCRQWSTTRGMPYSSAKASAESRRRLQTETNLDSWNRLKSGHVPLTHDPAGAHDPNSHHVRGHGRPPLSPRLTRAHDATPKIGGSIHRPLLRSRALFREGNLSEPRNGRAQRQGSRATRPRFNRTGFRPPPE